MNVTCIICRDRILSSADVYSTKCGHLFHYTCLSQWLARSNTCPQCRNDSSLRKIHRVYFNVDGDDLGVDVETLQCKLEDAQAKVRLKDGDLNVAIKKYEKIKAENELIKIESSDLTKKLHSQQSQIYSLKDQVQCFKNQHRIRRATAAEVNKLKEELKQFQAIQAALEGSREDVEAMLHENDPKTLAMLAAVLKKTLVQSEVKAKRVDDKLKAARNETANLKRLLAKASEEKSQLEQTVTDCREEKDILKKCLADLVDSNENVENVRVKRIMSESPAPLLPAKRRMVLSENVDSDDSQLLEDKVAKILKSNSPYLPVKIDNFTANYRSVTKSRFIKSAEGNSAPSVSNSLSVMRRPSSRLLGGADSASRTKSFDVYYNGLGGHSKEDVFPTSSNALTKQRSAGLTTKTPSSLMIPSNNVTSVKFRKLAASAGSRRN